MTAMSATLGRDLPLSVFLDASTPAALAQRFDAVDAATTMAGGRAEPGEKPSGAIARQTSVTVSIVAIDPAVPSVTFKGPKGNTRTIKVMHPEKLQGVSVGDTVEITYTEAVAIEVEAAPKK